MSREAARAHHASSSGGSEGTIELGSGMGSNMILASKSPRPSLKKGSSPVNAWKVITASDQRSALKIDLFGAASLFGAHVKRGADEETGLGDAADGPIAAPLGDAEIEHFGDFAVVVGHQVNVLGLEIAVNDADGVRAREGAGDVRDETVSRRIIEPRNALEPLRDRLALQELHHDVGGAGPNAVIEYMHDVRAAQLRFDLGLALETGDHFGLPSPLAFDELDCARDAETEVRGLPHRPHAPFADLAYQPEAIGNRSPFAEARWGRRMTRYG